MLEMIMITERKEHLEKNRQTRANRYYLKYPKTILGEMQLEVPGTRDGDFKSFILPERKRIMFFLDDIIRAIFIAGISAVLNFLCRSFLLFFLTLQISLV